ncbi:hypothetical protein [Pectinatus frisingensis]|nr:hypothetical protein [Pectinatus frisingensis]
MNEAIPAGCKHGYSNSRTCEVDLQRKVAFVTNPLPIWLMSAQNNK